MSNACFAPLLNLKMCAGSAVHVPAVVADTKGFSPSSPTSVPHPNAASLRLKLRHGHGKSFWDAYAVSCCQSCPLPTYSLFRGTAMLLWVMMLAPRPEKLLMLTLRYWHGTMAAAANLDCASPGQTLLLLPEYSCSGHV